MSKIDDIKMAVKKHIVESLVTKTQILNAFIILTYYCIRTPITIMDGCFTNEELECLITKEAIFYLSHFNC